MRELSLFSGAGGGLLGSKLLGWTTVGYVEYEPYCQKLIRQRIADGILDAAPIFGDIRKFISEGYADAYQGMVDVVSGGFPCQPFSVAGKQLGESDPRNMWPETIECIRRVRPKYALLENVPGILTHPYVRRIFGDLAESGYSVRWTCLGADDCGANHRRKRLWILAYAARQQDWRLQPRRFRPDLGAGSQDVADAKCDRLQGFSKDWPTSRPTVGSDPQMANPQNTNWRQNGQDSKGWPQIESGRSGSDGNAECDWWTTEPNVGRVANGIPARVDRLKSLGNAQVPIAMATAFSILVEGIDA